MQTKTMRTDCSFGVGPSRPPCHHQPLHHQMVLEEVLVGGQLLLLLLLCLDLSHKH